MEYVKFDIVEVAKKCGIRFHPVQANPVEFKAQCPFCGDVKYHLGLNREMERFHCFRCDAKGNSVSLYAKLKGISNKEAYTELKQGIKPEFTEKAVYVKENDIPIRSLDERHNVYYDFLNLLRLNRKHFDNLSERGLNYAEIMRFMYKSIPLDPVFRREVLEKLSKRHNLEGIPGFYRDSGGDIQMYIKNCGGMFIPVCNSEGYIQGLQMRLDLPEGSTEKKFRWFSSKHFECGTGAKSWVHVVGDTNQTEAWLTEGPMKADVSSVLSNGKLFIAIPGVNAVRMLSDVLNELNIRKVYEVLDMDKRSKPEVKKALITLRQLLKENGIDYVSCNWDAKYKGFDDYCLAKTKELSQLLAA